MVRDSAVFAAVEAGDRAACVQDVEQNRSDECRRDHICAVVCRNFGDSIFVQVLHSGEFYGIFIRPLAEHLAFRLG